VLRGERGDLRGFAMLVWSFQSQHWAWRFFAHFLAGGERDVVGVDRDRARAGGVDTDADDALGVEALGLLRGGERALHAFLKTEEVVGRVLPGEVVVLRVEQDALLAGGIINDAGAKLHAVRAADDKGAHRVGAIIDA
jgi:hypothetical protein